MNTPKPTLTREMRWRTFKQTIYICIAIFLLSMFQKMFFGDPETLRTVSILLVGMVLGASGCIFWLGHPPSGADDESDD